jgi:dienelactone hydrolase
LSSAHWYVETHFNLKGKPMGTMIELKSADGTRVPAYEARPAGVPKGAVVVVQEIFGVNSHIRAVADGYAAEGYLAVAPAAFHRVKPGVELGWSWGTPTPTWAKALATKRRWRLCPRPG